MRRAPTPGPGESRPVDRSFQMDARQSRTSWQRHRKRCLMSAAVALVACVAAAPAAAVTPFERQLQAQVKTLKKQANDARAGIVAALAFGACSTAATVDALQGTWAAFDQHFPGTFGAQQAVNDHNTCSLLNITRARSQTPPNVAVLQALLNLFGT